MVGFAASFQLYDWIVGGETFDRRLGHFHHTTNGERIFELLVTLLFIVIAVHTVRLYLFGNVAELADGSLLIRDGAKRDTILTKDWLAKAKLFSGPSMSYGIKNGNETFLIYKAISNRDDLLVLIADTGCTFPKRLAEQFEANVTAE